MKNRIFILITFIVSFITVSAQNTTKKVIDIYYLTANAYCPSVEQIENETRKVLDSTFMYEKEQGLIVEHTLNIMNPENKDFTSKWEIYTNGLIILYTNNNTTKKIDLNDFAFSNVPSDVQNFRNGFEEQIKQLINEK